MASSAQTLANKENAQHSTGPRTPEGKRQSSCNSLRHGLTSQIVVLPGEDPEAYRSLRASMWRDLAPEGAIEEVLLQTVCDTQWRLERARGLEANLVALAHFEEVPAQLAAIEDEAQRTALISAHGYDKREKKIRNLQLQEGRLQRTLFKSLADLRVEQSIRQAKKQAALRQAVSARAQAKATGLPFDPAALGFDFTDAQLDREELLASRAKLPISNTSSDRISRPK